jgi:hypothetical protein
MAGHSSTVDIDVSLLRLDLHSARFVGRPDSQNEAFAALAAEQRARLLGLARHVARWGLNPARRFAVMPDDDNTYIVLDGNRRLAALRILMRPDLMKRFLTVDQLARLRAVSETFSPPEQIPCVVFATRDDASVWLTLEHTGLGDGSGLFAWNTEQRVRGVSAAAQDGSQLIEFVLPER